MAFAPVTRSAFVKTTADRWTVKAERIARCCTPQFHLHGAAWRLWSSVTHKGLDSVRSFPDRTESTAHRKFDHENETFRAISYPQFGFLNQSMRFPVCRFSVRRGEFVRI